MSAEELDASHRGAKAELGSRLVILGHHYQRDEIIRWADFRGDSFKLSQQAASRRDADYIVFCGVHFMAESADILAGDHQRVILPNLAAGCSMADMADEAQVLSCWKQLERGAGLDEPGHPGHLHELVGRPQGILRRARRRRVHVVERDPRACSGPSSGASGCSSSPTSTSGAIPASSSASPTTRWCGGIRAGRSAAIRSKPCARLA